MEDRIQREKDFHDSRFDSDEGSRGMTDNFYYKLPASLYYFNDKVLDYCNNKSVLEYGCGTGSHSFELAKSGATVTGIDISTTGIEIAKSKPETAEYGIEFFEMDAENLRFDESSFDVVVGSGILHHLDLEKAYSELARVLSDDGRAVFREPLGHNPFINLFRFLTPKIRSEDEHPFLMKDIYLARKYFSDIQIEYFHLFSLMALPLHSFRIYTPILKMLTKIDRWALKLLPFLGRYTWIIVLELSKPKRSQG
jgi:ubiquinone/menaquinone biosynthesis C-methylase UbiE